MKHLKTFESFSINEEEGLFSGAKKFLTGHGDSESKAKAKSEFEKILDEAGEEFKKNPKGYSFTDWDKKRESLLNQAEENKFLGSLRKQVSKRGPNAGKIFLIYDDGLTGLQKIATGSGSSVAGE